MTADKADEKMAVDSNSYQAIPSAEIIFDTVFNSRFTMSSAFAENSLILTSVLPDVTEDSFTFACGHLSFLAGFP